MRRLCAVASTIILAVVVGAPAASAATYTIGWTTKADFRQSIESLRPGDTLRLQPGTYDIGGIVPSLAPGTAQKPIRITAVDPANRPLLRGSLVMRDADYWTLTRVVIQGAVVGQPALAMAGGDGWAVTNSEFSGGRVTGDYANVAISHNPTTGLAPRDWQFTHNCVHDAATRPAGDEALYMNVYVNIEHGGSSGLIARNILFNAPGGDNVKIGAGGDSGVEGANDVRVEYNTMYNALHQIIVFGNVKDIEIARNLMIRSTDTKVKTGQYLTRIPEDGNTVRVVSRDNYGYLMQTNLYANGLSPTTYRSSGNLLGPDPRIVSGCGGFQPQGAATAYGRYATTS